MEGVYLTGHGVKFDHLEIEFGIWQQEICLELRKNGGSCLLKFRQCLNFIEQLLRIYSDTKQGNPTVNVGAFLLTKTHPNSNEYSFTSCGVKTNLKLTFMDIHKLYDYLSERRLLATEAQIMHHKNSVKFPKKADGTPL